jgi:tRNA A37 methylthiotransferase MiaB
MQVKLVTSPHLDHSIFQRSIDDLNQSHSQHFAQCFAPMGLVSLAVAGKEKADITITDINKQINSNELSLTDAFYDNAAEWLIDSNPDVVGFMTESDSYHHLLRIFHKIKEKSPNTITLLGGVHATAVHRETLRNFPAVDLIIRGEGEIAFQMLLENLNNGKDLAKVNNLTYRHKGAVMINSDLPLIHELDSLPFPDFSGIRLDDQDIIYVEIGRGCPFKCNFCFTAPYWQRKHRIKSSERIIRELKYFKNEYGRTDFNFTHDLFTTDRRWVINFCKELSNSDLTVSWTCSSRTDTIDEEQIYWMKQAGCRDIYFGVETGTEEMQKLINKGLDLKQGRQIISKNIEAGISATVGFIAGLPKETDISLRGTLTEALYYLSLPNTTVHLFGFCPYRGSPNFENIKGQLIFDEHFVDFPLPAAIHAENCKLMRDNFDIFTRYSRMNFYENLPLSIVRTADEFFPIVNAIPKLILQIHSLIEDPLLLLERWSHWISSLNIKRNINTARLYQGSVGDFLDFLEDLVITEEITDEAINEMIHWERIKNMFRTGTYPLTDEPIANSSLNNILFSNPSVYTAQFRHTDKFLNSGVENLSGEKTFAFYKRCDGNPAIVHVAPLVKTIISVASKGIDTKTFPKAFLSNAGNNSEFVSNNQDSFEELINQLKAMNLLISNEEIKTFYD